MPYVQLYKKGERISHESEEEETFSSYVVDRHGNDWFYAIHFGLQSHRQRPCSNPVPMRPYCVGNRMDNPDEIWGDPIIQATPIRGTSTLPLTRSEKADGNSSRLLFFHKLLRQNILQQFLNYLRFCPAFCGRHNLPCQKLQRYKFSFFVILNCFGIF